MKKFLCALLSVILVIALVSCGGTKDNNNDATETLKLGLGTYTTVSATNATEDANGKAQSTTTIAAITVDADGKIVACELDAADATVEYTADGKAVAKESFKTKNELGDAYNMKLYAGSALEWYEQADAFATLVAGKKLDEVKSLVAEDNKGTADVINAGCTVTVSEFVLAIENAFNNLIASEATANDTIRLGVATEQSCTDATEDKDGTNQLETTFFAAAVNADNKVVAAYSDCAQVKFTFNAKGESTFDATKAITTKRVAGANYGMSQWGTDLNGDGTVKEWNEQAAIFDTNCIGKTAAEIASLQGDNNYGNSDLQTAGCTILVNGFVKAAAKIG